MSQVWDLDGNGSYNDASGPSIARAYGVGSHVVSLLVTDSEGDSAFVSQTLNVTTPPAQVAGTATGGSRFLSPFPIVRISGDDPRPRHPAAPSDGHCSAGLYCYRELSRRRAARSGARAAWSSRARTAASRATQVMRLSRFESHTLRAGTVIKLFITKANTIGKYTRFKIRSRKPPART